MVNGLLDLPWWGVVIATLLLTHITIVSVTLFLHRAQAHRSVEFHPVVSHFFRFWLWLTTGMVTREWVAVHRKHHAKVETDEDPHSPKVLGIGKVLGQGSELYESATKNQALIEQYGQGTPNDWIERNLYSRYRYLGVSLLVFVDLALFGLIGLTVWAVQMLWIPLFAAGVINGLGHYLGYRNYETRDEARNILPWGILIGGEELHNNHHAFSSSAKLASKWWEIDVGWFYIRLLSLVGLARVKKLAAVPYRLPHKQTIDLDTVRAVVLHRLHITTDFGRHVLLPVLREELQQADQQRRRFLRRCRQVLIREEEILNESDRAKLADALATSQRLRTVYEFRCRLEALWSRTASNNEKLLVGLQEWCQQAEQSGIRALQEFSRQLKSYSVTLQPAH